MPYCSDCGEEVGADVRFCPNCGSEIRASGGDASTGSGRTGQGGQAGRGGQNRRGGQTSQPDRDATGAQGRQGAGAQGDGQSRRSGQSQGDGQSRQSGTTGGAGRSSRGGQSRQGGQGSREAQSTRDAGATGGADSQAGQTAASAAGTAGAAEASAGADPAAEEPVAETGQSATNPEGPMPFESGAFGHAFGYGTQDDYDAVLIGAIIEFVGLFIPFVNLIVRGYGMRLARASARGQVDRPEWSGYGGMFVDGLKMLALGFAFSLVWLIVAGVLGGGLFLVSETAGTVVFFLVMFVASLLFPASLVTYAAQDSFGAAFSPSYAGAFLASLSYVKAYVLSALITPLYFLVLTLSLFTIIGGPIVLAFGTYFFFSFWGYYYREAVAAGSAPPAPAEAVNPAD